MNHFAFVIPLRNPDTAQNWDRCVELCRETIASARNQTADDSRYRIILVCREFPETDEDECLRVIRHPFPNPEPNWEDQHHDKYDKIRMGLVEARKSSPCYVMKLDADDLVSSRLVEHVLEDDNERGYALGEGYLWQSGASKLLPTDSFHHICGSSNILFAEPENLPNAKSDPEFTCDLLSLGHNIAIKTFEERGTPLAPVPFPSAIYRSGHGENITQHYEPGGVEETKPNWKYHVGRVLRQFQDRMSMKKIDDRLRDEFSLPR